MPSICIMAAPQLPKRPDDWESDNPQSPIPREAARLGLAAFRNLPWFDHDVKYEHGSSSAMQDECLHLWAPGYDLDGYSFFVQEKTSSSSSRGR